MNYTEAVTKLGTRESRKVGNNTYLLRRGPEEIAVKLHSADVLTFTPKGVTYHTGGWKTVTTKARMNEHGPARIWSVRGSWILHLDGKDYGFAEGVTVRPNGKVTGAEKNTGAEKTERLKIKKYAADYIAAFKAGKVPAPSNGDCCGCAFTSDKSANPLGVDHLRSHMKAKERYYVPSLLVKALETGASQTMKWWVGSFWQAPKGLAEQTFETINRFPMDESARVEKALRRYIFRTLGHAA